MISRSTARQIAEAYESRFTYAGSQHYASKVYRDDLYDFLFDNDYSPWFCNIVKTLHHPREVKELVMRLHTGETQSKATPDWNWEQRRKLGQTYLLSLGEDILNHFSGFTEPNRGEHYRKLKSELVSRFELDGYLYRDSQLFQSEADVLDVEEERGCPTAPFIHLVSASLERH